ncbi:MAG: molybdenum cofactor guanylyltransferase [Acidobacteriota bacterium]
MAGYVLAGGRSSRMGRDKAQLPWNGGTLLDHVVDTVKTALGDVTRIGAGYDLPDILPDHGPLGGLWSALAHTHCNWVLITACDMPNLTPEFLRDLAHAASASPAGAVVPDINGRLHPLCAAYHCRLLPAAEAAVRRNSLKMHDFLSTVQVERWPVADPALLANLNTPEELSAWRAR